MNVAVVYCYPTVQQTRYYGMARRFVETWLAHPPGEHPVEAYVVCNGRGALKTETDLFAPLNPHHLQHSNIGWDIGAYQMAAERVPCDLLICFGTMVHFHRAGWIDRIVEEYMLNGPGLYGYAAYLAPNWHVRTTAFWLPPALLSSYPYVIGSARNSRYEFEHGNYSITRHVLRAGFPCVMVTWDGSFDFSDWESHAPDAHTALIHDQHIHP